MSSSNLVKINYMEEAAYGIRPTPDSGTQLKTARFTSESLSGTPATTESEELRTDRMSSGQVVTGLEVTGGIDFELSPDAFFDDMFKGAMMNSWVDDETLATSVELVPDSSDNQLATLTLGSTFANLKAGALVKLEPVGEDPIILSVVSVDTPSTVFTVATSRNQEAVSSTTMDVTLPQYLDIGSTQVSYLIGKAYTDVIHSGSNQHSQTYTGELVSGFSLNAQYGSIVTGSLNFMGNGYLQEYPAFHQIVTAAGGTVTAAGTTNALNASIDVPLVTSGGEATTFCIESFAIELDNGLSSQNCIGKAAPTGYDLGTAGINISASIYNSDTSYDAFMPAKLTQTPVALTFVMMSGEGGYAFHLPAVQLSFPDPAGQGRDQSTMLEAAGVAKVGSGDISSALRIYKL